MQREHVPLRHRAAVQHVASYTRNDKKESIPNWETEAERWVGFEPLRGGETIQAQAVEANAETKVVMRYYQGMDTRRRLVIGSRTWYVKFVLVADEIKHWMELLVGEKP